MLSNSLRTWIFIIRNLDCGFLGGIDSFNRSVYSELLYELKYKYRNINTINNINLQPVKDRLEEFAESRETYLSGTYFSPENKDMVDYDLLLSKCIKQDICNIAPKNVRRLSQFEMFLINHRVLDSDKQRWEKAYQFLFSIDEKKMV